MAPRIARHISMDLIKFAKSIDVVAYNFEPKHKSALEFARQMASPKLYKQNPNYEVDFRWLTAPGPAVIKAEFTNGLKWETIGEGKSCADLRFEFFEMAAIVEEEADEGGAEEPVAKPAAGGKKK